MKNIISLGTFEEEIDAYKMYQLALKNIHLFKGNAKEYRLKLKKL